MPKKTERKETPKQYFDRLFNAKMNDEEWARGIPIDIMILTPAQRKRFDEKFGQQPQDNRYEKCDELVEVEEIDDDPF